MIRVTKEGWTVLRNDTHLSKWVEETGKIDHNQELDRQYRLYGLRPGDTAIDIGACIGDTTVPMARIVGEEGRVFAFEPNPVAFACLVANTRFFPQVRCLPYAIGGYKEIIGLTVHPNVGASSLGGTAPTYDVVANTLDSFDLSGVRFIKIDVEGYEYEALIGGVKTIEVSRPYMFIETAVHGDRYHYNSRERLYRLLQDQLGYKVTPPIQSMSEYPQYDIFCEPKI